MPGLSCSANLYHRDFLSASSQDQFDKHSSALSNLDLMDLSSSDALSPD